MPSLILGSRSLAAWSGRTLVVGVTGAEPALAAGVDLPKSTVTHLDAALPVLEVGTKVGATTTLPAVPGLKADKVVLVGLGEEGEGGTDALRRAAGAAVRAAGKGSVALALPHEDDADLAAIAEGALSGDYRFTAHKSAPGEGEDREITVFSTLDRKEDPASVLETAATISRNVAWARDLVNTAPNLLFPQSFAEQVQQTAKASSGKLKVEVLDDTALLEGGFGGIVGVGQGSSRPPRIVVLSYAPRSKKVPHVALVGKGITFDTGGVCIKPSAGMLTMKSDMAGAAAVAATVVAAAELELDVAVTGYLCLAENMPGGNAQRPGDVVTMRNGSTVEIIDTDAEGRMVLADGMALAAESYPDQILDVATLTGACVVALGPQIFGVMGNDEELRTAITEAADRADEPSWPLPLPTDLRSGLDSAVADLAHKGDRWGGALTAGLFLQEFAKDSDGEQIPWAHLDIAGPSFNEGGATGHLPKGGTGVAVGTLLEHLANLA
ncbi:leucyl aminopeptidase [Janibacter hoylei]|uniref:Probable cytosol aminopeptidase n=1 Tax=Janibacter hoylei PVAS-1 TaxID=1210046 RepID=K1DUY2_9MICO|nr:leucyl aminopeptidase [Janibacter hoylei]EKA60265.1 leucyl aminopeptidase [Janibacter hoylei PVAS-1]MCT1620079.1 leucyl aminopeptidase [Janibacter hoylei]MCT2292865.1 leucyl aminopeptidase [Janibacter hoylei]RWU83812.1 leucyl aminopeptidase [Janibacter hoylei PVAS-1]